jgi:hypothetical protein
MVCGHHANAHDGRKRSGFAAEPVRLVGFGGLYSFGVFLEDAMPLPRIVLFAFVALFVMVGVLWSMDVNYVAWIGAWLSPERQYPVGFAVVMIIGFALAYLYAHYVGNKLPGNSAAKGAIFGAVLAAFSIWVLPPIMSGIAEAAGNTQVVFQGRGITNDEEVVSEASRLTQVQPCPPVGGIEPPLRFLTQNSQWAAADAWQGRLLPFGVAFLLWGVVIGASLSEQVGPKKK